MKKIIFCILTCSLFLVGCASVGNNFDEGKISEIKKGETTGEQLVSMFGEPQSRTVNSEGVTTMVWMYSETKVKGESFIPYVGAFMGGGNSKSKTLMVSLAENKVTGYTLSGGGTESRYQTQDAKK